VPASPWATGPPLLATTWGRCIHYTIYNHTTTTITMATNPFTISPLPRGTVPLRMGGMRWQALQFIILKTHPYIYICVYIYIYISLQQFARPPVCGRVGFEPSDGRDRRCLRARGPQDLYSIPPGIDEIIGRKTYLYIYIYIYTYCQQFVRPPVCGRVKSILLVSRAVQWTWSEVPRARRPQDHPH
jgi:hypothetical protein